MEKGHWRRRRRGRAPRLLEQLVGEGAPPAQDRGEEAARRARLAALMEALWAGLQGLERLLRSFFARRQPAAQEEEAAAAAEELPLGSPRHQGRRQRQGRGLASLFGNKLPPRHKREPRRPPSPPPRPPRPLLMVRDEPVPEDVETQYREYCRKSARLPKGSCLCHLCFFVQSLRPNDTVPEKEMITHCNNEHRNLGKKCKVQGCRIRVDTERAGDLHTHFVHPDLEERE